jgi:hypothetical protein
MLKWEELRPTNSSEVLGFFLKTPSDVVKDLAVFLPPATGQIRPLLQEGESLAGLGFSALVLRPPYVRAEFSDYSRGITNPDGEIQFWDLNVHEINLMLQDTRDKHRLTGPTVLLGKNLGGSYAAYAARTCSVDRLITFGSIPSLSKFWLSSLHPVAQKLRAQGQNLVETFSREVECLDLITSLNKSNAKKLLQYGHNDEWIDSLQKTLVSAIPTEVSTVQWFHDDHEMNSLEALEDRSKYCIIGDKFFLC